MTERIKHICGIGAAFIFLLFISYWRQPGLQSDFLSFRYPLAVYCGYLLLLGIWGISIYLRLSQSNLRRYLYVEIAIMAMWFTVRFIQETLIENVYMLRLSGYLISIPVVLLPLYGFFGVLSMDKSQDYCIRPCWKLLLLPAMVLIGLMLTNEYHHLVFLAEPVASITFRPNVGVYLIALWAVAFELIKLVVLLNKVRRNRDYPWLRFFPFCMAIIMGLIFIPYFFNFFTVQNEWIELAAKHYFLEAMLWEACIELGIVPVNSQYGWVFEQSMVAMRITDFDGRTLIASRYAPQIRPEQFAILQDTHRLSVGDGLELCLHRIPGGYLIWLRDFTTINQLLQELQQTSEELQQEGDLIRQELEARSEEARVQAQNAIYDQLSSEVSKQIEQLERMLIEDPSDTENWSQIGLIGTYVKRLCNLRLIYQETGTVNPEDLRLSLQNMMDWLKKLSVDVALVVENVHQLPPAVSFMSIKITQCLLEQLDFQLQSFSLNVSQKFLVYEVETLQQSPFPMQSVETLLSTGYQALWNSTDGGFILTIKKEAEIDEKV